MLSFEEAKTQIKNSLEELGLIIADEHFKELFVKLTKASAFSIKISEDEINQFQQLSDVMANVKHGPVETSIIGDNFREQLIDPIGRLRISPLFLSGTPIRFGAEGDEEVFVEIGAASPNLL